jgi:hypothetical protein
LDPKLFQMWKRNLLSEDYHSGMNGKVFQDWLLKYLLRSIASNKNWVNVFRGIWMIPIFDKAYLTENTIILKL